MEINSVFLTSLINFPYFVHLYWEPIKFYLRWAFRNHWIGQLLFPRHAAGLDTWCLSYFVVCFISVCLFSSHNGTCFSSSICVLFLPRTHETCSPVSRWAACAARLGGQRGHLISRGGAWRAAGKPPWGETPSHSLMRIGESKHEGHRTYPAEDLEPMINSFKCEPSWKTLILLNSFLTIFSCSCQVQPRVLSYHTNWSNSLIIIYPVCM